MKTLMILGAAYSQVPLIQAAKELGYRTIVVGVKGNYPGLAIADEVCYTDIKDKEGVLKIAEENNIAGVTSCGMDTSLITIGYVCDKMGLCGLTEEAAHISTNKYLMKCTLINSGVNTSKFYKVSNVEDLESAIKNLNMPLIVKAVDLQGSQGVNIARTKKEVFEGYERTMRDTKEKYCIIEEFIEGEEFGAEAFVKNGEILFVLPHGRKPYMSYAAIPIGHHAPLILGQDIIEQAEVQVELAIRAMGLNNCAVNADLIVKDGKVSIIEITGRAGGVFLTDLVSIYYGINYHKMIDMLAVGENPYEIFDNRNKNYTAFASRMLISENDGVVKDIINKTIYDNDIYDLSLDISVGSTVKKFNNLRNKIGHVIVKGDTVDYCLNRIEDVISNINIILE